jgi:hypothetical protein
MPRFQVTVEQQVIEQALVVVDAPDEDTAKALAVEQAYGNTGGWTFSEICPRTTAGAVECTPVSNDVALGVLKEED